MSPSETSADAWIWVEHGDFQRASTPLPDGRYVPEQARSFADVGIRMTLEALRDIALDPEAKLKHEPSGVTLRLDDPEKRLSVIASALEPIVKHLKERWPDA